MRRRWSAVVMVAAEQSNVIRTGVGSTLAHGGPAGQRRTAAAGGHGTYTAPGMSAGRWVSAVRAEARAGTRAEARAGTPTGTAAPTGGVRTPC
ncbi:hypothetical protein ACFVZ8_29175 [Streptomyces sp. NPDC059558]|uniref:hypothetical protein n=1 Tax=Streptomyces sp. NPDC059558 TaxID=3346864 RepID=UPI0036BB9A09